MQPSNESEQNWQQPSEQSSSMPPEEYHGDNEAESQDSVEPVEVPEGTDMTQDDAALDSASTPEDDGVLLRWQASEYIHHERSPVWYVVFGIVVVGLVVLALLVFKSWTFAILVPVMAVALVMYVKRPPAIHDYTLSRTGLHINDRLFPYSQFKSFGVMSHNDTHSVILVPRKRFQLGQTLYFPDEVGEPLVDMLAARLPMKEVEPDMVDKLLSNLHL